MNGENYSARKTLLISQGFDSPFLVAQYYLPRFQCNVARRTFGIEAARAINSEKYPLILSAVRVAPGISIEENTEFSELRGAWHKGISDGERYFNVALQLVKYAREERSPNKNSLIIFVDTLMEKEDFLIPNVKERVLKGGADDYICMAGRMMAHEGGKKLVSLICDRLRWF